VFCHGKLSRLMQPMATMTVDELLDEFDELLDWEERCDYLIDLGFELPKMADEYKTDENFVHGCQSNVWLYASMSDDPTPVMHLTADSDAMIVRGLIAVLLTVYSGRTAAEILDTDINEIFEKLGLNTHLSSTRRNGLHGMVQRVRALAAQAATDRREP